MRQLLACRRTAASGANDVPPLVDVDAVFSTGGFCDVGVAQHRCQLRRNCQVEGRVDKYLQTPKACFLVGPIFHQQSLPLWSVRRTGTVQLLDFNIAATLLSFIMSERWLESRAKQSTGDAIASLMALQAPTALLVEEDGMLVEREIDANLLLECIAYYLVFSTTGDTIRFEIWLPLSNNTSSTGIHRAGHSMWC